MSDQQNIQLDGGLVIGSLQRQVGVMAADKAMLEAQNEMLRQELREVRSFLEELDLPSQPRASVGNLPDQVGKQHEAGDQHVHDDQTPDDGSVQAVSGKP